MVNIWLTTIIPNIIKFHEISMWELPPERNPKSHDPNATWCRLGACRTKKACSGSAMWNPGWRNSHIPSPWKNSCRISLRSTALQRWIGYAPWCSRHWVVRRGLSRKLLEACQFNMVHRLSPLMIWMSHQWHLDHQIWPDCRVILTNFHPIPQFQGKSTKLQVPYVDISLVSSLCSLLDARLTSNNLEPWNQRCWWWFRLLGSLKLPKILSRRMTGISKKVWECSKPTAAYRQYPYSTHMICWFRIFQPYFSLEIHEESI